MLFYCYSKVHIQTCVNAQRKIFVNIQRNSIRTFKPPTPNVRSQHALADKTRKRKHEFGSIVRRAGANRKTIHR